MIYTHSILGQQGFSAETRGIVRDRQRRQRQVSRLHRLGPGALERFIEAIEDGADIPSALSSHANESRDFLYSLQQTLPYARQIDEDGTVWLFGRDYRAIWVRRPGEPPEPASGETCWARWGTQHWFYTDFSPSPWRKSPEARALRRDLEEVLREFRDGDHDGPVARKLIKETEKEQARQRATWDARIARRRGDAA